MLEFLQRLPRRTIVALAAVLIVIIGVLDYVTGTELSFSVFYLVPVALMAWFVSRRAGVMAACASAIVWLLADLADGRAYTSATIPYWNAGVRFSFFLIVTLTLASLRDARSRQEELAHFVVHDLRSPLANILTGLQYLLDFTNETLDDAQQDLIQLSIASGNRMMTLVNSLLDRAQLESGKLALNRQQVTVEDMLTMVLEQVSALTVRGEIEVSSQVESGAEIVFADAELTARVLVNLLSNALKFSPKDTSVEVKVTPHPHDMIAISVSDRGSGIPKEWAEKVFSKFAQVEARKAGVSIGSGLGLTFCRLAVEAQGGRIWLESAVGKGTTVTFTLPRGQINQENIKTLRDASTTG